MRPERERHTRDASPRRRRGRLADRLMALLAGVMVVTALPASALAQADEIKLGGFWISNVRIVDILGDELLFENAAGREDRRLLENVEGLGVAGEPALREGHELLADDKPAEAATKFRVLTAGTHPQWLQQWALYHMMLAYDQAGDANRAVIAFIQLAERRPSEFFLARPPLQSVLLADAQTRETVANRVTQARRGAAGRTAGEALDQILKASQTQAIAPAPDPATGENQGEGAPDAGAPDAGAQTDTQTGAQTDAQAAAAREAARIRGETFDDGSSVVPLSAQLDANDAITRQLRTGEFEAARQAAQERLRQAEPRLAMRLYQLGLAQLYLAEKATGDQADHLYRDAGLSMMRVAIYFDGSLFKGPALLEAGYIHARIGQPDLAASLYDKARVAIDPDLDPDMEARRLELVEALNATPNG